MLTQDQALWAPTDQPITLAKNAKLTTTELRDKDNNLLATRLGPNLACSPSSSERLHLQSRTILCKRTHHAVILEGPPLERWPEDPKQRGEFLVETLIITNLFFPDSTFVWSDLRYLLQSEFPPNASTWEILRHYSIAQTLAWAKHPKLYIDQQERWQALHKQYPDHIVAHPQYLAYLL